MRSDPDLEWYQDSGTSRPFPTILSVNKTKGTAAAGRGHWIKEPFGDRGEVLDRVGGRSLQDSRGSEAAGGTAHPTPIRSLDTSGRIDRSKTGPERGV